MDKKILNEDIQNMKYLFGYKPGRVISEQDHLEMDEEGKRHPERHVKHKKTNKTVGIFKKGVGFNPTIHGNELGFEFHPTDIPHGTTFGGTEIGDFDYEDDDFISKMPPYDDDDEDNLFEQEEPENDRYMFFSNLQQIHRQMGILLEKDPEMISEMLDNGHDWAQDHIATAKESIDQVFDFIMNEEEGDSEEMFESHENENKETLRKQLHTLVGNEMKLGKKADMGGAAHHKEEHKKAEKELKDFLRDNPSMEKYQDEVEEHFYKQLYG
jgi:hypothetical protein